MKLAATVVEREKQVFYERPRSKVKISTPLDSDAEEAPSLEASGAPCPCRPPPPPCAGSLQAEVESSSTSDSENSESSDQLGEPGPCAALPLAQLFPPSLPPRWEQKQEDEATSPEGERSSGAVSRFTG